MITGDQYDVTPFWVHQNTTSLRLEGESITDACGCVHTSSIYLYVAVYLHLDSLNLLILYRSV